MRVDRDRWEQMEVGEPHGKDCSPGIGYVPVAARTSACTFTGTAVYAIANAITPVINLLNNFFMIKPPDTWTESYFSRF